jgi:hypothetical protein
MSNLSDYYGSGGAMKYQIEILASGTSWSLPANLIGDIVWVSAIAGGESFTTGGSKGGQGGSYIMKIPKSTTGTVTYSLGAGGTGNTGANGSDTVWDNITLIGGGVTGCTGSSGAQSTAYTYGSTGTAAGGAYGTHGIAFNSGGGMRFSVGTYGYGGSSSNNDGGAGIILVEWWETI